MYTHAQHARSLVQVVLSNPTTRLTDLKIILRTDKIARTRLGESVSTTLSCLGEHKDMEAAIRVVHTQSSGQSIHNIMHCRYTRRTHGITPALHLKKHPSRKLYSLLPRKTVPAPASLVEACTHQLSCCHADQCGCNSRTPVEGGSECKCEVRHADRSPISYDFGKWLTYDFSPDNILTVNTFHLTVAGFI